MDKNSVEVFELLRLASLVEDSDVSDGLITAAEMLKDAGEWSEAAKRKYHAWRESHRKHQIAKHDSKYTKLHANHTKDLEDAKSGGDDEEVDHVNHIWEHEKDMNFEKYHPEGKLVKKYLGYHKNSSPSSYYNSLRAKRKSLGY